MTALEHNNETPEALTEALRIADYGIRVLPIKPGQKRPPMAAWQEAATDNPTTIVNWFTGLYKGHGLGVATGETVLGDCLFVLDVDEHDPATSGGDTLHELEAKHGALPETVEVLTGSGGRHLYFWSPVEIRNDAGKKLGPGLDIRGEGGQVVAPPTLHPNGQRYEWLADHAIGEVQIAQAPEWLVDMLTVDDKPTPTPTPTSTSLRGSRDVFLAPADSIADRYNDSTTWEQLLQADGWTIGHVDRTGETHWVRPGKTVREGTSATTGWNGLDVLKVFTSSVPWLPEGAYSRFQYLAYRDHRGDMSATAKHLTGTTRPTSAPVIHEAAAPGEPWPDPIPLMDTTTVPAFPVEVLPSWITEHATSVAEDLQVSPDLPANLALGALSVATIGNATVTYPRQRWTQPLNLYMAVALPPSAGKSPAKSAMFKVVEDIEEARIRKAQAARLRAEAQRKILEKRQRNLEEKAAKSGGDDALAAEMEALDIAEQIAALDKMPSGKLLVDDVTTEALGVELADAGGSIAVVSAEGGLFDRIAGLYNDQHANLDLYLEGWSGGRYSVSRIGRAPILVPKANVCVVTTVQPTVLDAIGARKDFAGRGLTARFLLTIPKSNVGRRDRMRPSDGNERARTSYEAHLTDLAERTQERKAALTVTGETSDIFATWDQQLEDRLAPGQDLEHLAEWVGKLRASVLRLAGLLHLANQQPGDQITPDTMRQAITLGEYYLIHATAISDRWGADGVVIQARQILEWARRTDRTDFTVRELQRSNGRLYTTVEDTRGPLELLIERGWIRPLFDGPLVLGRRGVESPKFAVRPENPVDMGDMSDTSNPQNPVDMGDMSDNPPKVSDMSDMSPKHVLKSTSIYLSLDKPEREPADMSDMSDNSPQPPKPDLGIF